MFNMLSSAWRFRYFILSSISTEFRSRFIRSRLGGLWMILHPLSQVLIFSFALSAVLSARLPGIENRYAYGIYLMAGMLAWSLFTEIVSRCLTLFIDNGNLIKKLAFPKITLPIIATGTALVNNGLLFISMLAIFGAVGHSASAALFWLPGLVLINIAFSLGVGLTLGVLNVFLRDIGQIVPVVLQFMFWFTPIAYMTQIIPERYQPWLVLNPLIPLVTAYHEVIVYNRVPDVASLATTALIAGISLLLALVLFRRASPEMVDLL